MREIIYKWY